MINFNLGIEVTGVNIGTRVTSQELILKEMQIIIIKNANVEYH